VSGHSHTPHVETRNGVLFVNPGSAGPRRFKLPVSVARLWVEDGRADIELVTLFAVKLSQTGLGCYFRA
jgi:hypothetical protein